MSYAAVDSALQRWARRHSTPVASVYRDEEVRSLELVDSRGRRFQIWLEPPAGGTVAVRAWDFGSRRTEEISPVECLEQALDAVHSRVMQWMAS